ncbi:MAG: hypothetical protein Q7R77_03195 [Candidatus Daviesbacteria bacterium]|nr:hypothetical protein [Candidatus Daviesbacteria bacterium]
MVWIHRLYVLFLGIILSITTGFGIAAFYPQPVRPADPFSLSSTAIPKSCYSTPEAQAAANCQVLFQKEQDTQQEDSVSRQKYDEEMKAFQNKNAGYTRTAIFFGIAIGAIFAISGIGLIRLSKLVAAGLLLAGVLTAVLTRLLIGLASLGASAAGNAGADTVSYMEFGILAVLSAVVIAVGLYSLKDR